ncbi:hypothetical protein GCM10027161_22500 [Microbispora hainanensis]
MSSDSFAVMYGARFPLRDLVGYHRETMSSLAFAPGTQGSTREVSLTYRDVVPTGWGPVGSGRRGVLIRVDDGSAATDAVEPGEGSREGAPDPAEPYAEAQETAAVQEISAATTVAPRRIREGGDGVAPPTPAPFPTARLDGLSLSNM